MHLPKGILVYVGSVALLARTEREPEDDPPRQSFVQFLSDPTTRRFESHRNLRLALDFRPLTEQEVTITVECEPELDVPVRGNALVSGDPGLDKQAEDEILDQVRAGNMWAWCTIKVIVTWRDHSASDVLGACSYKSSEDFIQAGDYFPDMVARGLELLNEKLQASFLQLASRAEIPKR